MLSPVVPRGDHAVERLADDCFVGRFHDGGEPLQALLRPATRGDIAEDQDGPEDAAGIVVDGSCAVVDGAAGAVPRYDDGVIGKSDDRAVTERAGHRAFDATPGMLVHDHEDVVEAAA